MSPHLAMPATKRQKVSLHSDVSQGKSGRRTDANGTAHSSTNGNSNLEMLQRKRDALNDIVNRHDDLVRELFHLDKFVTLVSYDPKVAKLDKSDVFMQVSFGSILVN